MAGETALIGGATGLVGRHCLTALLEGGYYQRVIALTRRPLGRRHPRLEEIVVDFEKLDEIDPFPPATDVFCAMGTTIRRAGSQAAFLKVDFEYPRIIAARSAAAGARRFLLVSSVGADARSNNFYLRVKAELEKSVNALPLESTHIFRPSFLVGEREETRLAEVVGIPIARALQFALIGGWRKYRPIAARIVAAAMVAAAKEERPGRHVYHYDDMVALAGRL